MAGDEDLEPEPESEEEKEEGISRGRGRAEDDEEEEEAEHAHRENESVRGGIGITTTLLASGLHRVQKVLRGAPAANAGAIKTGDTLIRVATCS